MVNTCLIKGCRNERYPGSPFSFHRFPRDEEKKEMWRNLARRDIQKHSVVCSAHFRTDDFLPNITRKILKPEAIPFILPVLPEKQIVVLNDYRIPGTFHPTSIQPSEIASENIKVHHNIGTQTQFPMSPKNKQLKREIKILQQRLKRKNATITNLKSLLALIKKKATDLSQNIQKP